MAESPGRSAHEIETTLFQTGPMYLPAAFAQPEFIRATDLSDAPAWFGLDEALARTGLEDRLDDPVTVRWLALLRACVASVSDGNAAYVDALVDGLTPV